MQEWQLRVITEKANLDEKINKLANFDFDNRDLVILKDSMLLENQLSTMVKYSNILNERILNFKKVEG